MLALSSPLAAAAASICPQSESEPASETRVRAIPVCRDDEFVGGPLSPFESFVFAHVADASDRGNFAARVPIAQLVDGAAASIDRAWPLVRELLTGRARSRRNARRMAGELVHQERALADARALKARAAAIVDRLYARAGLVHNACVVDVALALGGPGSVQIATGRHFGTVESEPQLHFLVADVETREERQNCLARLLAVHDLVSSGDARGMPNRDYWPIVAAVRVLLIERDERARSRAAVAS